MAYENCKFRLFRVDLRENKSCRGLSRELESVFKGLEAIGV